MIYSTHIDLAEVGAERTRVVLYEHGIVVGVYSSLNELQEKHPNIKVATHSG